MNPVVKDEARQILFMRQTEKYAKVIFNLTSIKGKIVNSYK